MQFAQWLTSPHALPAGLLMVRSFPIEFFDVHSTAAPVLVEWAPQQHANGAIRHVPSQRINGRVFCDHSDQIAEQPTALQRGGQPIYPSRAEGFRGGRRGGRRSDFRIGGGGHLRTGTAQHTSDRCGQFTPRIVSCPVPQFPADAVGTPVPAASGSTKVRVAGPPVDTYAKHSSNAAMNSADNSARSPLS
jgi:hypothetical protein